MDDLRSVVKISRRLAHSTLRTTPVSSRSTSPTVRTDDLDRPLLPHIRRDAVTLRETQTVGEALEAIRKRDIRGAIVYFYVLDEADRLVGVVPARGLLMCAPGDLVGSIMDRSVVSIPADATLLTACEFFAMHRFLACPVVDGENRLLGVADIDLFTDEVFSLAEKRSADDLFQLIGVHVALGRRGSALASFRDRFPWLLCNIAGGTLCAVIAGLFDALLSHVVALALFIPVVLALSESVSIQSMTITLQSLHGGRMNWRRAMTSLWREFLSAGMIGLACGAIMFVVSFLWRGEWLVSLAIAVSICVSMITSCLVGVALPTLMRALRQDPRIASGPIVLATADLATLLFYLTLAGALLSP